VAAASSGSNLGFAWLRLRPAQALRLYGHAFAWLRLRFSFRSDISLSFGFVSGFSSLAAQFPASARADRVARGAFGPASSSAQ